jgi:hypothetical protein
MKKFALSTGFLAGFLLVLAGCQQSSTQTDSGKKLTVEKPSNVTIHRGGTQTVKVNIKRNNYTDPVKVSFDDLPEGVKVDSTDMTIAKDKNEGSFTLKAADDAKLVTDKEVKVIAKGDGNLSIDQTFKLTVKEKDKDGK